MTFKDIFKKSFIEGWSGSEIDALSAASVMAITLLLALFIFLIYKITTKKQFYSRGFNISLVGTALITAAIILTVQSNIVISLGMVGALSIVRFRTAIKEPMDLMFLFWSISIGIICGAGLAQIGIILSITMTVVVFALDRIPSTVATLTSSSILASTTNANSYLFIVVCTSFWSLALSKTPPRCDNRLRHVPACFALTGENKEK